MAERRPGGFVGCSLLGVPIQPFRVRRSVRHAVCGTQCAARSAYPQSKYGDQFLASMMLSETAVHNAVGGYTAYRCFIERIHSLFCCFYFSTLAWHSD
jgi:hypothetical protein